MRLEFQLTFDDFREAHECHKVAALRAKRVARYVAMFWQLGAATGTGILATFCHPWAPAFGLAGSVIVTVLLPAMPWVAIFCYSYWFQIRAADEEGLTLSPWTRAGKNEVRKVKKPLISKAMRGGIANLVGAAALMAFAIYQRFEFLYGYTIGMFPWSIYVIYAAMVGAGTTSRQIKTAWNRQTQLHDPTVFEVDQMEVSMETPDSRMKFKWTAFPGLLETPNLFLIYRNTISFHIIPKRTFASPELMDAFRHMVKTLAGKQPSAFPVLPMAATGDQTETMG